MEITEEHSCSSSTVTITPLKPNFFPTSLSPAVPRRQWISSGPSVKHIDHCRLFEDILRLFLAYRGTFITQCRSMRKDFGWGKGMVII
ncbi:hypothetical protein L1887_22785 [Cichorium endivia]|nr:hypothetical protein L1887_22785 [Cichorium endivia]